MWAACCVVFLGCLRCSEFNLATVPNQTSCDHTIHLSYSDVVIDTKTAPTMVILNYIKQSKTNSYLATLPEGAQVNCVRFDRERSLSS